MDPKARNLMQVQFTEDNAENIVRIFEELMGVEVDHLTFLFQSSIYNHLFSLQHTKVALLNKYDLFLQALEFLLRKSLRTM